MERVSTRQRTLEAALTLFARFGYGGVSLSDLADEVGVKPPSLYKHFPGGKKAIYAALNELVAEHYRGLWEAARFRLEQLERQAGLAGYLDGQALERTAMDWFSAQLADPRAQSCRRLAAGELGGPWLWETPVALYEETFTRMIGRELLRRGDPHVMAVQFLSPLLQLLALADNRPEQAAEVWEEEARRHLRQFHRVFAKPPKPEPSGVGRLFRR